jgi:hypothetical protein
VNHLGIEFEGTQPAVYANEVYRSLTSSIVLGDPAIRSDDRLVFLFVGDFSNNVYHFLDSWPGSIRDAVRRLIILKQPIVSELWNMNVV